MRGKIIAAALVLIPAAALYAIGWISGNAAHISPVPGTILGRGIRLEGRQPGRLPGERLEQRRRATASAA